MSFVQSAPCVQILQVPDCPLVGRLRWLLEECFAELDCHLPIDVVIGDFPSPTLVIDGIDVATGRAPVGATACRLDLPSRTQILTALSRADRPLD